MDDPAGLKHYAKQAMTELPPKEERNLASCVRAVRTEIHHQESPEWKRRVSKVPRVLGIPAASRVLDHVEDLVMRPGAFDASDGETGLA